VWAQIDLWAHRIDAQGHAIGSNILAGDANRATHPDADTLTDGGFIAVWDNGSIPVGRMFDATVTPRGPEFPLSDRSLGIGEVRVAVNPHGGFATLVHRLDLGLGAGWLIVRRFAGGGTPPAAETILPTRKLAERKVRGGPPQGDRGDPYAARSG